MTITIEQTLAAEALDERVSELEGRWQHVATFRHEDGSVTVIELEEFDQALANPRDHDGNVATLVGSLNRNYRDPDEGKGDSGIAEALDRWDWIEGADDSRQGRHSQEYMIRRYLAMFRPDILHFGQWSVTGSSQSNWNSGYGFVRAEDFEAAGVTCTPAEAFEAEVKLYGEWFGGDVYYALNVRVGAPLVTYGDQGAYVSGYDLDEVSCGLLLGYPDNESMAAAVNTSPITKEG